MTSAEASDMPITINAVPVRLLSRFTNSPFVEDVP